MKKEQIKIERDFNGMKINRKIFTILTLFLLSSIFIMQLTTSAGVASPYWIGNPIKLAPGESTTITLSLQNMVGGENITFRATVSSTTVKVTFVDSNQDYFVPFGTDNVPVKLKIEVPKDVTPGNIYTASVSFQQVSSGEGGMIRMASGFSVDIPVQVVGEKESVLYGKKPKMYDITEIQDITWIIFVVLISVVIIVVFLVNYRKKSKLQKK